MSVIVTRGVLSVIVTRGALSVIVTRGVVSCYGSVLSKNNQVDYLHEK